MALLTMIVRKMVNNKWMEVSLLLGLVLTVALVTSVPMYQGALMQRILMKDMAKIQQQKQEYPGKYWITVNLTGTPADAIKPLIESSDRFFQEQIKPAFHLDAIEDVRFRRTDSYPLSPFKVASTTGAIDRKASVGAMNGMEEKARLVEGRFPSKETSNGVYEAVVTQNAIGYLQVSLGDEFTLTDPDSKLSIQVKIVGVVSKQNDRDLYWYDGSLSDFSTTLLLNFDLFLQDFVDRHVLPVQTVIWYFALDFSKIGFGTVKHLLDTDASVNQYLKLTYKSFGINVPAASVLVNYYDKTEMVRRLLWSLSVPVLFMLAYYLYMTSNLSVDRQKSEISVLRSRGANRLQIVGVYLVETAVLGLIALLLGPFLGKAFTLILGASNGFLQFVNRDAVQVVITPECYLYAILAVLFAIMVTLIPAIRAARLSIVNQKRQMARTEAPSFWHRSFLDILLLGLSLYGLYNYHHQMQIVSTAGPESGSLTIEPLLLMVPTLFIIGLGLFILRIYPWLIRLVYWLGKRWWSPSLYSTLIQVGRSCTQYQFLMAFLILTISTGLYSASAAGTINQNAEDQIHYKNGADVVLSPDWHNDDDSAAYASAAQFTEPDFQVYAKLPGVEHAAKVFTKKNVSISTQHGKTEGQLFGIDTYDFGHTAWFRDDLLNYKLGEYLDLMAPNQDAVLVSKAMADRYNVKAGDSITIGWNGVSAQPFIIYAVIEYFPSTEPNMVVDRNKPQLNDSMFVVGHLQTIQQRLALDPYQIWLKLTSDESRQDLYAAITSLKLQLQGVTDTGNMLIESRNDPLRLAVNGGMTLGFLISLFTTFIGFLLYWILTMKGRILQYGVLRAMGISYRSLISMITVEQVLTSGAGLLIGAIVGKLVCLLYIPLLQISFNRSFKLPPFRVFFKITDSVVLYSVVSSMILVGLLILATFLSRIKIYQAVKLGED